MFSSGDVVGFTVLPAAFSFGCSDAPLGSSSSSRHQRGFCCLNRLQGSLIVVVLVLYLNLVMNRSDWFRKTRLNLNEIDPVDATFSLEHACLQLNVA